MNALARDDVASIYADLGNALAATNDLPVRPQRSKRKLLMPVDASKPDEAVRELALCETALR